MDNRHQETLARIGLNILYYRKQKGYTQQRLAELTSYSKNHIQQVETAKTLPSVIALLDIAEALVSMKQTPSGRLFIYMVGPCISSCSCHFGN